jgi:hypothetical protein
MKTKAVGSLMAFLIGLGGEARGASAPPSVSESSYDEAPSRATSSPFPWTGRFLR